MRAGEALPLRAEGDDVALFAWRTEDDAELDWRPASDSAPTAPRSEGTHWLGVRSRDVVGQLSAIAWHAVRVDESGPQVRIRAEGEAPTGWWASGASARCRATDPSPVSSVRWRDGDDATTSRPIEGNGIVELACSATDVVDNRSTATTLIPIDARAPRIGLVAVDGRPLTRDDQGRWLLRASTLHATTRDAESGLATRSFLVDGSEVNGPWTPRDGAHRLRIEAVDRIGLRSTLDVQAVVDTIPPRLELFVDGTSAEVDGRAFYRGEVRVRVEVDDDAELRWSENGATWRETSGTVATLADWLVFRARDAAGNTTLRKLELPRDDEPPRATLRLADGRRLGASDVIQLPADTSLRVELSDEGAGVCSTEIRRRRRGLPRWSPLLTSDGTEAQELVVPPGHHLVEVRATDCLGNVGDEVWRVRVGRRP